MTNDSMNRLTSINDEPAKENIGDINMTEQTMNCIVEQTLLPAANGTSENSDCEKQSDMMERWKQKQQEAEERWQQDKQDQKTSIFNRLKLYGILEVVVNYRGSGDEGSIDGIEVTEPADKTIDLEDAYESAHKSGHWNEDRWSNPDIDAMQQLAVDIEKFCTEELEYTVGGWEIDEGSDGTFTFDVEAGTVTCSHNQYYTKSDNHTWEV